MTRRSALKAAACDSSTQPTPFPPDEIRHASKYSSLRDRGFARVEIAGRCEILHGIHLVKFWAGRRLLNCFHRLVLPVLAERIYVVLAHWS